MQQYEYKVVPAPARGEKERGLKTGAERFAHKLSGLMNEMAREGWDYLRAETLPAEERSGLTGRTTVYHNLLVFRRARPLSADTAETQSGAQATPACDAETQPPGPPPAATDANRALRAEAPEGVPPALRARRDDS